MTRSSHIIATVARFRKVGVDLLRSETRARRAAYPRQEAYYALRERTDLSFAQIGRMLGHRDHTTVMQGVSAVHQRISDDPGYAHEIDALMRRIDTTMAAAGDAGNETAAERARRVVAEPADANAGDALALAVAALGVLSIIASDALTDQEARVAARHVIAGGGPYRA